MTLHDELFNIKSILYTIKVESNLRTSTNYVFSQLLKNHRHSFSDPLQLEFKMIVITNLIELGLDN